MTHHVAGQGPHGAGRATTLLLIGSGKSEVTGAVTPLPGAAAVDDLAVFIAHTFDGSGSGVPSSSTPSGWSSIVSGGIDYGGDSIGCHVYKKKLTSGDISGGSIATVNASYQRVGHVLVFRPYDLYTSWDNNTWSRQSQQVASSQTITASSEKVPCVLIATAGRRSSNNVLNTSITMDGELTSLPGGGSFYARTKWKIFQAAPQNINVDNDYDNLASGLMRLTGAP